MLAIIDILFNVLYILIIARIVISFIRVSPYHPTWGPIIRFIYETTEPLLAPIRNIMPTMGGLDFSPMILLILASVLRQILVQLLF